MFRLPNGTLAAFYGSCHSETPRPAPYLTGRWNVGLAVLPAFGQPFVRMPFGTVNPVPLNANHTLGHAENPVVTWLPHRQLYVAVFDDLASEADGFGLAQSADGVHWTGALVPVPGGARTPLALVLDPADPANTTALVFFTRIDAAGYENVHMARFQLQ